MKSMGSKSLLQRASGKLGKNAWQSERDLLKKPFRTSLWENSGPQVILSPGSGKLNIEIAEV
jgi:hypothetical protein